MCIVYYSMTKVVSTDNNKRGQTTDVVSINNIRNILLMLPAL